MRWVWLLLLPAAGPPPAVTLQLIAGDRRPGMPSWCQPRFKFSKSDSGFKVSECLGCLLLLGSTLLPAAGRAPIHRDRSPRAGAGPYCVCGRMLCIFDQSGRAVLFKFHPVSGSPMWMCGVSSLASRVIPPSPENWSSDWCNWNTAVHLCWTQEHCVLYV